MKKITSVILAISILLGVCVPSFAAESCMNRICGLEQSEEEISYARSVFSRHLNILISVGELDGNADEYSLGHPFSLFNVKDDTCSSCFPILEQDGFVAILEVYEDGGELNASAAVSFSKELEAVFAEEDFGDFVLLTDGIQVQAYNGRGFLEIYELYETGEESLNLAEKYGYLVSDCPNVQELNELKQAYAMQSRLVLGAVDRPTEYKTLNVAGVSQSGNTCWAATCAALINYYKGQGLNDVTVATYVYGSNWNQGGSWTQIKKAYNHWGLYPTQTSVIAFSKVKSNINSGKPMHLGLNGHSVGLIGYEDWSGSASGITDRILILLEPNGGVHRSVTLNASGNFTYALGGGSNAWLKTREF